MQARTIQGVPFLLNTSTNQIYAYEKPVSSDPLLLGTFDPVTEKYTLVSHWKTSYEPRLLVYRGTEKGRSRLPAVTAAAAPK